MAAELAPWEEFPEIWPTKAKFMAWLRGGIRKAVWTHHPVKIEFVKKARKRVLNKKTGNMVWGGECYKCGEDFLSKDLQVDHLRGNNKLTDPKDIQAFMEAIVMVGFKDLGLICKPCHQIKSYAERMDITFEEAVVKKKVIAFGKLSEAAQKDFLKGVDIDPKTTGKARREQYREYLEDSEQ